MHDRCENCTERCPQAEMTHQAAIGRMYATKEFIELLKKVKSDELVEVVLCKDCKYAKNMAPIGESKYMIGEFFLREEDEIEFMVYDDDFCSYGERRNG